MISTDIVSAYNASRAPGTDRSVLCHAPFISLNFDQSGHVTACCYNRHYVLGTYPQQSVREIWNGAPAQALREAFLNGTEARGCDECFNQLRYRNFSGTLMRNFDTFTAAGARRAAGDAGLPLVMEFEISNQCNLECVMCAGHWSSAIRARREKLPPIPMPYDEAFVGQIEEFLPTISAAKFLGGEPFLIRRYHEIWDSIIRLNPEAQITITTSGATLPERSRRMLEKLRANICVSLDGITASTYESIRRNARYDEVMENIAYFRDYTRRRGTGLGLAVCPMTHNWHELRQIVEFGEGMGATLHVNTVMFPADASLAGLDEARLAEVVDHFESAWSGTGRSWAAATREQWQGLINQLRGWLEEKRTFSRRCSEASGTVRSFADARLAGNAPARAALAPLIEPLVTAVEIERAKKKAGLSFSSTLLPRTPLGLWPEGQAPDTRDLLLAAQVIHCFVAARDSDSSETDRAGRLDRLPRLQSVLDEMYQSADGRTWLDGFGAWMRQRFEGAEAARTLDLAGEILDRLHENRELVFLLYPGEVRRRFDERWARLGAEGLEEDARARIGRHFDRLVNYYSFARYLNAPDGVPGAEAERPCPIANPDDLAAAFNGIYLFHLCFGSPAEHESLRRRLDTIKGKLTTKRANAIVAALNSGKGTKADATHIHRFVTTASDDEFARAIDALSA